MTPPMSTQMNTPNKSYALDRDSAMKANGNIRIQEKGKYYGQFTRAEFVTSTKGTIGIDFTFKSNDGATADFLTIWTQRQNGEALAGRQLIDALMTCLRLRSMDTRRARVEKYNPDSQQRDMADAEIYPDLMHKPIGLLLVTEEYINGQGQKKSKMVIWGFFEASTDKTAREILRQQPAQSLPSMVASLRDKTLPQSPRIGQLGRNSAADYRSQHAAYPANDGLDSDIPF